MYYLVLWSHNLQDKILQLDYSTSPGQGDCTPGASQLDCDDRIPDDVGNAILGNGLEICSPGYRIDGSYSGCARCVPGSVQPQSAQHVCLDCSRGSYSDILRRQCVFCPMGKGTLAELTGASVDEPVPCVDCFNLAASERAANPSCQGVTQEVVVQTTPTPLVCGDGVLTSPENCDDGNTQKNDGCSQFCNIETLACGDRLRQMNAFRYPENTPYDEKCDDGNNDDGDGCSATCTVEPNWSCKLQNDFSDLCVPKCGDGIVDDDEQCDDGNQVPDDGCTLCQVDCGFLCDLYNGEYRCMSKCGDGKVSAHEQCDTAAVDVPDACDDQCRLVEGWNCSVGCSDASLEQVRQY